VKPSAPERYRVQFTIGEETHAKLRRVQALLRREIPDGDPGEFFDRALSLLLERALRTKRAKADQPRPTPVIRPETDAGARKDERPSRLLLEAQPIRGRADVRTSRHLDGP
jgi:hypothetical protein